MEIHENMDQEIERRLRVMEESGFSLAQRFGGRDFFLWGAVLLVCLAVMICGAGV